MPAESRDMVLVPREPSRKAIDLRQFGFSGHVSDEAMAELRAADRRARLVLATAHQHWFGR